MSKCKIYRNEIIQLHITCLIHCLKRNKKILGHITITKAFYLRIKHIRFAFFAFANCIFHFLVFKNTGKILFCKEKKTEV